MRNLLNSKLCVAIGGVAQIIMAEEKKNSVMDKKNRVSGAYMKRLL